MTPARLTDYDRLLRAMPENELLANVRALVKKLGGVIYHTHNSQFSEKGFPDCTIVLRGRVIFSELKSEVGKTSPEQVKWLDGLSGAGAEVYLWMPTDWVNGEIEQILIRGPQDQQRSTWVAA